ncbi:MAG TPA: DVUA0089 family protein, partial [Saprospiraceae bacterium]|nr:DVUA0089 family protein [Saprospiraceae bacterium]
MTSKSLTHLVFGVLFGCLFLQTAMAQISTGGKPYSFARRTHTEAPPPVLMPGINLGKLQAEDLLDEQAGLAPRFGDLIEVSLNTNNSGVWETLPDGGRLWRLSIMAAGAKSINLLYDDFYLPSGGELYIYSADRKHVIGGFTSANNKADRIFATGLVYSDHIVLEYYEPEETPEKKLERGTNNVSISINYVVHGYRFIEFNPNDLVKAFGSSGSCNVNTICSQGDNWRDQIKSVAMLLSGGNRFCTGFLVNNTAQDCRPLLLTANHCLGSADAISSPSVNTWTFMWRYESPNCTPNTDGPTNMTTNGGTVLANPGSPGSIFSSDFALIELAENPKTAGYDVYFAGFDATTTAPSSATGIHHPSGDVKKISMENAALTGTSYSSTGGTATHWRVADWDSGTTEPGSSGSPIFSDATKRAMGFLSGGGAACGNDLPDWYGSLGYSWTNGGASDSRRRLNAHLDPGGLATFVDGSANPCASSCNTTALFPGTLTTEDPTYNRLLVVASCALSSVGTNVHYDAHSFTLTTAATVTVSIDPGDGASISPLSADTYLSLYGPGGFNPASPCTNAIAVHDDINGSANRRSRIVTGTLAAGTYTAVLTSFDNVPLSPGQLPWTYSLFVSSPGLCTLPCPTFSAAPANVSIVDSSCGSGC